MTNKMSFAMIKKMTIFLANVVSQKNECRFSNGPIRIIQNLLISISQLDGSIDNTR